MYFLNSDGSPDVNNEDFSYCQCSLCMKKRKRKHYSWFSWMNILIFLVLIIIIIVFTVDFKKLFQKSPEPPILSSPVSSDSNSNSNNNFEMTLL